MHEQHEIRPQKWQHLWARDIEELPLSFNNSKAKLSVLSKDCLQPTRCLQSRSFVPYLRDNYSYTQNVQRKNQIPSIRNTPQMNTHVVITRRVYKSSQHNLTHKDADCMLKSQPQRWWSLAEISPKLLCRRWRAKSMLLPSILVGHLSLPYNPLTPC